MSESIAIPAEYLDTITDALNCERRQYQELTIDCPDPYYAEKIAEIDAALAALDQARQAPRPAPSVRAEPVPDWADAPEWANFWAVDDNGRCFWYEYKPTLGIRIWLAERGNNEISKQYPGWRNTLQERPRVEEQD